MDSCFSLGELSVTLFEFGFEDWIDTIWAGRENNMDICWPHVEKIEMEWRTIEEEKERRRKDRKKSRMEYKEVKEAGGTREWMSLGVLTKGVTSGDTTHFFWMA